jgi:hypothetical protein
MPASKTALIAAAAVLTVASLTHRVDPWLAALVFLGLTTALFRADLRAMLRAARPPV